MAFFMGLLVGFLSAGGVAYALLDGKRQELVERLRSSEVDLAAKRKELAERARSAEAGLAAKQKELAERARSAEVDLAVKRKELAERARSAEEGLAEEIGRIETDRRQLGIAQHATAAKQLSLDQEGERLSAARAQFEARVVAYSDLQGENRLLKRDLRNMDTACRKQQLDSELQGRKQVDLDQRAQDLGGRYLKETVKWIGSSLNQNNFAACKQRLLDAIERCRGIGHSVPSADEAGLIADLKLEYEEVVRSALAREEQARIKAQIREEQQREREKQKLERELEDARRAQDATARAVAAVEARRAAEIERVRAEMASLAAVDRERALADVEAKFAGESARLQAENAQLLQKVDELTPAVSMAQLTKSGHVYVISNIGSFGEGVFKVGMTRRLDPEDRIWELGDASVPFPFDVHMLISTKDAPTLENALHRALHQLRLNKVNLRKEFFRVDLQRIAQIVQEHHGEVKYVATPEALEYHQSITMTLEDQEFIEEAYEKADDDSTPAAGGE